MVFDVALLGIPEFEGGNTELRRFEPGENPSNQLSLDAVGLDEQQGAFRL